MDRSTAHLANVTLIDLRATPIEEMTRAGLRTSEAEYKLDSIAFYAR
jgi:hypothetical protein